MTDVIKTRTDDGKELSRTRCADNWFTVYQDRARYEGRRMHWLNENSFEVIFTEKHYALTLIKEADPKPINPKLSLKKCWDMVNRIQMGDTPEGIRERAQIAEKWLTANEVITREEYDELMDTVAYLVRESYHMH